MSLSRFVAQICSEPVTPGGEEEGGRPPGVRGHRERVVLLVDDLDGGSQRRRTVHPSHQVYPSPSDVELSNRAGLHDLKSLRLDDLFAELTTDVKRERMVEGSERYGR